MHTNHYSVTTLYAALRWVTDHSPDSSMVTASLTAARRLETFTLQESTFTLQEEEEDSSVCMASTTNAAQSRACLRVVSADEEEEESPTVTVDWLALRSSSSSLAQSSSPDKSAMSPEPP